MNHESLLAITKLSKDDKNAHSLTASEKDVLTSKLSPFFQTAMPILVSQTHDETGDNAGEETVTECEGPATIPATNDSDINSDAEILDESQHESIKKYLDANSNTANTSREMELEENTISTDQNVNSPALSPCKNQAASEEPVTESEKKDESIFDSAKPSIEVEVEGGGTIVGRSDDAAPAPAEGHAANQLRSALVTESTIELAEAVIEKPCLEYTNLTSETDFSSNKTTVEMDFDESETGVGTAVDKQPETTCAPGATSVQMNSEDAVTWVDTTSVDQLHDTKEYTDVNDVSTTEGHATCNPQQLSPSSSITKTAAELASLMFKPNGLTTPLPKAKRRKSNKKEKRRRDYSSRRTSPRSKDQFAEGFSEFFTPKQHNVSSRPSISMEESVCENERHEFGASEQQPVVGVEVAAAHAAFPAEKIYRTATSHGEAFAGSLGLMTQPDEDSFVENDNEIESTLDMTQSAELDFLPSSPSPVFSPLEVATRKLKPSQRYGSHEADPSDDDTDDGDIHNDNSNDASDLLTQQDEGYNMDKEWLDQALF
jgi:hypothetical protein